MWATYHLQLVLPKFLLPSLIKEGEVTNMVDKYISQDGQIRFLGRDLALVRLEGGAEAPEGGGRVELVDLPFYLLRDELALEVCGRESVSCRPGERSKVRRKCSQCSCLPVKVCPGGGGPPMLAVRTGRAKVELAGAAPPSSALSASSAAISKAKSAVVWCEELQVDDGGGYELLKSASPTSRAEAGWWLGGEEPILVVISPTRSF